jgi:hypothetical protein
MLHPEGHHLLDTPSTVSLLQLEADLRLPAPVAASGAREGRHPDAVRAELRSPGAWLHPLRRASACVITPSSALSILASKNLFRRSLIRRSERSGTPSTPVSCPLESEQDKYASAVVPTRRSTRRPEPPSPKRRAALGVHWTPFVASRALERRRSCASSHRVVPAAHLRRRCVQPAPRPPVTRITRFWRGRRPPDRRHEDASRSRLYVYPSELGERHSQVPLAISPSLSEPESSSALFSSVSPYGIRS